MSIQLLRTGSRGADVVKLQKLLGITADGIFGPITRRAVIDFQRKNHLRPDGIVGVLTWAALMAGQFNKVQPAVPGIASDENGEEEGVMVVTPVQETKPTCSNLYELAHLIRTAVVYRRITRIIYHCTASHQTATVEGIVRYWREKLGWSNPGYHIIVRPDGSWTYLQDFNLPSNGVKNRNINSIHVSYIGGIGRDLRPLDNRTPEQHLVFEELHKIFRIKFPEATHHGHNEFSNKACPSFDVGMWIDSIN